MHGKKASDVNINNQIPSAAPLRNGLTPTSFGVSSPLTAPQFNLQSGNVNTSQGNQRVDIRIITDDFVSPVTPPSPKLFQN
jgi:hypothetical protein